ncbi:MAG: glycosyl hydrolase [Thermoguttaceae bacterium]
MKISISFLRLTFILSLWCCIFCVNAIAGEVSAKIDDSKSVLARFVDPPREYSSGPLWVWNDMLSEREVLDSLRDLAGQHIRQAFVHPRPGLMTPYLSPEWFRLWKAALVEAEKLDMNLWIYDENSYPSGFAGGFVPEEMPESQSKSLQYRWEKQAPKLDDNVLGAFLFSEKNFKNATANIKVGEIMPQGKYLVFFVKPSQKTPWLANRFYVDLLRHGVAEKFLDITLNAYQRHFGDQFGKRIPGSFTDEPNLNSSGGLPWSDGLADEFQKRWGYSLLDNLPALVQPQGDWKRVRHDFYQLLLEQFIENWAKPYHDRCKKFTLEFTGHYWDHAWPNCLDVPDNMAMYAWSQRPAIDCLMNQYSESVNAQFGNLRMVKELSSVANQLGRKRTLCETYGAAGWELRFEDMKRIGDWLFALGVNTMDEHLSYITIRGSRKRDHPQSFSYHEPWWEAYHVMVDYFTRLSAALSSGEEINHILVVEPTTTAWLYQADRSRKKHLDRLGRQFQRLVVDLSKNQVEYDIGCENIIARHGSVDGAKLIVGRRAYSTLVLPPMTETLNATTMELLEKYAAAGGKVFCCGEPPALVDGRTSVRGKTAALNPGWKKIQAADLADSLLANDSDGLLLRSDKEDRGILYHLRRRLPDGELLFLVNTSIHSPTSGTIQTRLKSVSQWDAMSGKVKDYPAIAVTDGLKSELDFSPSNRGKPRR